MLWLIRPMRAALALAVVPLVLLPLGACGGCSSGTRQESTATPARLKDMRDHARASRAPTGKRPVGARGQSRQGSL